MPWQVNHSEIVQQAIAHLGGDYKVNGNIAIHKTATVEEHVVLKGPVIIGPNSFVAAHCYLRGGVWLIGKNSLGPGCEVKSSVLFPGSNLAHFNFIGDSIIGSDVNFEAGSVIANHYNERTDKEISVRLSGQTVKTGVNKFGSLVGDRCRVGANAVLSPGSILKPGDVVDRLALLKQVP